MKKDYPNFKKEYKEPEKHENPMVKEVSMWGDVKKGLKKVKPKIKGRAPQSKGNKASDAFRYLIIIAVLANAGYKMYRKKIDKSEERKQTIIKNADMIKKRQQMNQKRRQQVSRSQMRNTDLSSNRALLMAKRRGAEYIGNGGTWDPRIKDKQGFYHIAPGKNPTSVTGKMKYFYRDLRNCSDDQTKYRTIVYLYNGYTDYTLGDRKQEMCQPGKGSTYYVESVDLPPGQFPLTPKKKVRDPFSP